MPGEIWNPRPTPAQVLPVTANPDAGSCFDPSVFEPLSFQKRLVGGAQRGFVFSDAVKYGFYWWVLYLTAIDSDPNGQALDLFLVDPAFRAAAEAAAGGASGVATPDGCYKIVPQSGVSNSGGAEFSGQLARAACFQNQYPAIIVPGGWSLLLREANTVVSAIDRNLTFRFLRAEIKNGVAPPF